ncbi:hypothetical protein FRC15_000176 [Serendipita sp. 397]|nr:hypothetical protein FRC15_000176 [Serendipita sp. 397]
MKSFAAAALSFITAATAGTVVWDGSFTPFTSSSTFDNWSWSNQVGTYQWYIHGASATSAYLNTGASYKNPAITREDKGLKLTVDSTSHWNGQTMMRTELIPQTSANLGTGQMYYHFSIMHQATNPPGTSEHQIMFFESHFTELKVGIGSDTSALNWCVGGQSKWSTAFTAGVWYNFAYDINFSGQTVGLWASTGSNPLVRVMANQSAGTSTNSADFHVGVLRLGDSSTEDWYISGVYIESGSLTTNIGSGVHQLNSFIKQLDPLIKQLNPFIKQLDPYIQ